MGVFMATLDSSIVNIALPTLVESLNTDFAAVQWVVLGYILVITTFTLGIARLGDMYDKKKLYLGGIAVFTLGSFLCASAVNINWLIAFRAIQGLGAAFLVALGIAIISEVFPPEMRGRALGTMGSIVSVGIAIGPPLGGLIIGLANWRWIFLVNLPVGIFALWIVYRSIPPLSAPRPGQRFDMPGALVMFLTLAAYAAGMTFGQRLGFDTSTVRLLLTGAVIGIVFFIWIETRTSQPMIDLKLFKNPLFGMNLLMAFLIFIVMGGLFIMPFYLELVQGYPIALVGVLMMVLPISMGLIAPLAGSLSDRFGPRIISLIGLGLIITGCLGLSTLQAGMAPLDYIIRTAFIGAGVGFFQSPNNSAIMGAAPRERMGIASGLMALSRTLGQTTGLPLMGALFTTHVLSSAALPAGFNVTEAGQAALVVGIQGTFRTAAFFLFASTLIAVASLYLDQRRKRSLFQSRQTH
jgi:EmrB/QacA subfamily drug resistance transporter